MVQAGDFSSQAQAYAHARPGYPSGLVDALIARVGLEAGMAVADVGAGTGLFTRCLTGRGLRVTAIEPSRAMQARAPGMPDVEWRPGTFEATGLPAASQNWVVAAQAFHWADSATALPELRRVLKPGGWLSILWNDRRAIPGSAVERTQQVIDRFVPGFAEDYRGVDWSEVLASTGDFGKAETDEQIHVVVMSASQYMDLWNSHNRLAVAAGSSRAALLAAIEDELRASRRDPVEVTYLCQAWSARRL